MSDRHDHEACVRTWLASAGDRATSRELVDLLQRGFAALWARASQPLGEVTLGAIAERVLFVALERHPALGSLSVVDGRLRLGEESQRAALDPTQLLDAIHFVLVELLTVLGNLTAGILTPALHAELSRVAPTEGGPVRPAPSATAEKRKRKKKKKPGEGAKR